VGVVGKAKELRWRAAGHYTRPLPDAFVAPARGGRVLEIGGPTSAFREGGLLPLYPAAASVDNVQWAADTLWHGEQTGTFAPDGAPIGRVHVVDGGTLDALPDGHYDAVISAHVIEHLANPLRALAAWRRVTRPGGGLVLVAPHWEGTFDHRRGVTPLEHLVEDFERGTGEDDLTHLEETLRLHDRSRDAEDVDPETWAERRRQNLRYRLIHHHVFTTTSLVRALVHAGVEIDALEVRYPHDIWLAGRFGESGAVRVDLQDALLRSPFRVDREAAARPSASAPAAARRAGAPASGR
jgi:SAM-dependent methyltransferase